MSHDRPLVVVFLFLFFFFFKKADNHPELAVTPEPEHSEGALPPPCPLLVLQSKPWDLGDARVFLWLLSSPYSGREIVPIALWSQSCWRRYTLFSY